MKFPSFLRHNRISRRILFLISLPRREEFASCSKAVEDCISELEALGVDVRTDITFDLLSTANQYDIIISVTHYNLANGCMELADRDMPIDDYIDSLAADFNGIIDLSSCYSAMVVDKVKERCPNCHVLGAVRQVSLELRLSMYPSIIRIINENNEISYYDAYQQVLKVSTAFIADNNNNNNTNSDQYQGATKLGDQSSIFSPAVVRRGEPYFVQVFFHKNKESDNVVLSAKRLDPATQKEMTILLPIRLKRRDRIEADFVIIGKDYEKIDIDQATKSIIWMNATASIQFCVTVAEDFFPSQFKCRVKIEVNRQPVGECYFTTQVNNYRFSYNNVSNVELVPYDIKQEREKATKALLSKLNRRLVQLDKKLSEAKEEESKSRIESERKLCQKCINLVSVYQVAPYNQPKKVFVSSTSDMAQFREIMRKIAKDNHLSPNMYEDWVQMGISPHEACCYEVLRSDAVICILGPRYGHINSSWDMSMTEIEYNTALSSGKPILVFIYAPNGFEQFPKMEMRQQAFINQVRSSRILKIVSDENMFNKSVRKDLENLIKNNFHMIQNN